MIVWALELADLEDMLVKLSGPHSDNLLVNTTVHKLVFQVRTMGMTLATQWAALMVLCLALGLADLEDMLVYKLEMLME